MPFYAVAKGRTTGIFMTWSECEAQVKGFSGARYKKFDTVVSAQDFINSAGVNILPPKTKLAFNNIKKNGNTSLKRTYTTSGSNRNKDSSYNKNNVNTDEESDGSDDLNTIITKQLDDIENRIEDFEKGISKIVKKSNEITKNIARKAIMIDHSEAKKPRMTKENEEFEVDTDGFVKVYTDGACSANGRRGAKAGLGVYWGNGHNLNVSEPVSGRATNNCGEIQAATKAIKIALSHGIQKLSINTDSKFLINSVTKWMSGWKRKGWKLASGEPVKNEKDFKDLDSVQNKLEIKWNYVEAHQGIYGNEMADQLAKAGAAKYET